MTEKNGEGLGTLICDVGAGLVPDYKYMQNKPEIEFLTGQVEYLQSCERMDARWTSCLVSELLMMKFSTLLECGPLPSYIHLAFPDDIHVISVPGLPHFLPLFHFCVLY